MAAPQPPPFPARPQRALPAAQETRRAESFRPRRLEKGRSQVRGPRSAGVAGEAPSLAAMARGPSPNGPPEGSEVPRGGARALQIPRAKGFSLTPTFQRRAGGEPGPTPGRIAPPDTRACLGLLGLLYSFSYNWKEGATKPLWRILIPSNLDSGSTPPPKPTCSPPPHPTPPSLLG